MREKGKRKHRGSVLGCVVAGLVLLVCAGLFGVGNYLVTYAIARGGDGGNREVALEVEAPQAQAMTTIEKNDQQQRAWTAEFLNTVARQTVQQTAADGTALVGEYFPNDASHLWAIVIHGYRGNRTHMYDYAQHYHAAGYRVLAPDLRGCGESGGEYIGMGWLDRKDIGEWITWVLAQDPQAKIVLHGVSMGAATVMMTAGEETPDALIAFVEDCGYTSVWDIFASELDLRFHLPTFPVLDAANMVANWRAGWAFKEASALAQVAKCEKPMLFIHGEQDDFVPYWMLDVLYSAKPGENKARLSVPEAGHGEAMSVLGEDYWAAVFAFIDTAR